MKRKSSSARLARSKAIEMYFIEHRAKLIDIAAFLDRVERSDDDTAGRDDFRMQAFSAALKLLLDGRPQRARRVLELFSDPTNETIAQAPMKGALGAYQSKPD